MMYGIRFFVWRLVIETRTPELLDRVTFRASVKLVSNALRIGMIELSRGMRMPIIRALAKAPAEGTIEGM